MSSEIILEICGTISKVEELGNVQGDILPNTLVLEGLQPFYGYYGDYPVESKPRFIFLITDQKYSTEEILRAVQNISEYYSGTFDAAVGDIEVYNDVLPMIRIRSHDNFGNLAEIQSGFLNEGIKFRKKKIQINRQSGIIKLKKVFFLEEVEKDVYLDKIEKEMGYFKIPEKLTWKIFEKITNNIKHNWEEITFDAAIGTLNRQQGLQDIIRIYKENIDKKFILEAGKRYLDRLKA